MTIFYSQKIGYDKNFYLSDLFLQSEKGKQSQRGKTTKGLYVQRVMGELYCQRLNLCNMVLLDKLSPYQSNRSLFLYGLEVVKESRNRSQSHHCSYHHYHQYEHDHDYLGHHHDNHHSHTNYNRDFRGAIIGVVNGTECAAGKLSARQGWEIPAHQFTLGEGRILLNHPALVMS